MTPNSFVGENLRLYPQFRWMIGVLVVLCIAIAVLWASGFLRSPAQIQSSVTRDSINIEIVETAPATIDTPQIKNTPDAWLELIENARENIDIEAYFMSKETHGPLAAVYDALYKAAARGVRIRILIENSNYHEDYDFMMELDSNENIEVRPFSKTMHSKVITVDQEAVYVGSANWSWSAMQYNREVGAILRGQTIARAFAAIFESGWSSGENQIDFENGWNLEWIYPIATPIDTPTWVAKTEDTIIGLIDSAQNSIHVFAYVYTGSPATITNALIYAANRGVNIQIIIDPEYRGYLPDSVKYEPNIQIKTVNIGAAAHSKVVIVDGQKAYVGSANWTNASMRERREIGIFFDDQTLASALQEIFNKDWESRYARWVTGQSEPMLPYVICVIAVGFIFVVIIIFVWRRTKRKSQ